MKEISKKFVIKVLEWEARCVLRRYKPRVIAVTGSIGKTGTKEAIFASISWSKSARKSAKSYNSEFGGPLSILDLSSAWSSLFGWVKNLSIGFCRVVLNNSYPEWLVMEIGADKPKDLKNIVSWVKPEIGVITGLGDAVPVHVEYFKSIEELIAEKGELLKSLPSLGIAIINRDDERAWGMRSLTLARVVSYGMHSDAQVRGDKLHISYEASESALGRRPKGITFRVDVAGKSIPVRALGVLGIGQMYARLAALAVAHELDLNLVKAVDALEAYKSPPGRMCILQGLNGSTLIDDTYNSSPAAVKMALDVLHELEVSPQLPEVSPPLGGLSSGRPRKIAVLGDMLELGAYSIAEHTKVGALVRGVADVLVCVGPNAKIIGETAIADGFAPDQVHFCSDSFQAGQFLASSIQQNDLVLLKASQSIRLERATELLLADPAKVSDLLARQDKEWKKKI